MKFIGFISLLLFSCAAYAQPCQNTTTGNKYSRTQYLGGIKADSLLQAPRKKVVYPCFDSGGLIAVDGGLLWYHNGSAWTAVGGGGYTDSAVYVTQTRLKARLRYYVGNAGVPMELNSDGADSGYVFVYSGANGEWDAVAPSWVNYADTAAMLAAYLRKRDTVSLSSRIAMRVGYGDTAAMLANYRRALGAVVYGDTAAMLSSYRRALGAVVYGDTAAMLANYRRALGAMVYGDTAAMLVNYRRALGAVVYGDTAAMLSNYRRALGAVVYGDTAAMLVNYRRALGAVVYGDTAAMLAGYARTGNLKYQSVQGAGSVYAQRGRLNFGSQFAVSDNGGNNSTDVGIAGTAINGSSITFGGSNTITAAPSGSAGGDLAGSYPAPSLAASGVAAGTYGSNTAIPVISVDAKGRATAITTVAAMSTGVTSVGSGYGMAGGPVTTTGTLLVDTARVPSQFRVDSAVANTRTWVQGNFPLSQSWTAYSVPFSNSTGGSNSLTQDPQYFMYNGATHRLGLGLGTGAPSATMEIRANALGTTNVLVAKIADTTAATVSINQNSPMLGLYGTAWKTTATAGSMPVGIAMQAVPVTGTSAGVTYLKLYTDVNGTLGTLATINNGGTATNLMLGNTIVNTGGQNTAVGMNSFANGGATASQNTFAGYNCGINATGGANSGMGLNTLSAVSFSGTSNVAIGDNAGINLTSGSNNNFFGHNGGRGVTTGTGNVYIGSYIASGGLATGNYNVVISDGNSTPNVRLFASGSTGNVVLGLGTATPVDNVNGVLQLYGNLAMQTPGNKLIIPTGANASVGTATLSGGTVTVSTTAVSANSMVLLTLQGCSNCGSVYISAKVTSTSFTITSSNASDASVVAWQIIN